MASSAIYLDHAATTAPRPEVVAAMEDAWRVANPSSTHRQGRRAYAMLDEARAQVAKALDVDRTEIVFCSSATEANNLALFGVLSPSRTDPRRGLLLSAIEHPSVLEPARELARRGLTVRTLGVDRGGALAVDGLESELATGPALVSVMLVNNEVGTVQPVPTVARLARERGALVHTDAVQAVTACDVRPHALGVDLLTLSGHKIGGPRGVGVLFVRRGIELTPLLFGGGQEGGRRSGTEHVAAAVGFAVALQAALRDRERERARLAALRTLFVSRVSAEIPEALTLGAGEMAPHIVACALPRIDADGLKIHLDAADVAVSSGSACAGRHVDASHVVVAMDVPKAMQRSVLRFSFGLETTEHDVRRAAAVVVASWRALVDRPVRVQP